jgi:hypothetical protein
MWTSSKKFYCCSWICSFVDCHFTYTFPDHSHPTSLFYLYSVSSFISISKLVVMPPCFWCFYFALCLKVWMSLHMVCGYMIEECIWCKWGRSKFVYHIIDWWQKSTLIYWRLLKQWNSIHFRQFVEAIFVSIGEGITNDHGSNVVCMKQYAVCQTEICYLNSWKDVIRNTTSYCNLHKSDSFNVNKNYFAVFKMDFYEAFQQHRDPWISTLFCVYWHLCLKVFCMSNLFLCAKLIRGGGGIPSMWTHQWMN